MSENSYKINVEPNNNIFRELGKNNYDMLDILSEFIDNSIAARNFYKELSIKIKLGVSTENDKKNFVYIKDNASGISRNRLALALTLAGTSGGSSLNEHGLGMKQAIASLGDLESICTKTEDDDKASLVKELRFGEMEVDLVDVDFKHGTEIRIVNAVDIPYKHQVYGQKIILYMGARYRRYLENGVKIEVSMWDVDRDREKISWEVEALNPLYFHPISGDNKAIYDKRNLQGEGWKARLTFGYAPTVRECLEIRENIPANYTPYHVSLNRQGLDIFKNDRVIKFHQLSELGIVASKHSKYNYIRGEIELLEGFETATTKNKVIEGRKFEELIEAIKELLNKGDFLNKKSYPSGVPESLLRDRLANKLSTDPLQKFKSVEVESYIEGLDGYVDVLADEEAFEVKKNEASGSDVYQLLSYLDIGNFDKGYLVAKDFKDSALYVAQYLSDMYNKEIELVTIKDMSIDYTLSEKEIKEYC